ncbi:fibronectin type III domain-containing protein [Kosmotoga pacifica]|uniref:Fibronectin type-III domain-containing protein n=1 Tax=Kosmotoga pacifica TaxID=1330330 RepID=A0A0G2ZE97_9BACT|nr:fibronectin type III domain-containing protein [Kosmotoga pacifica]AKI97138.1 hypothetical protein IX53_04150 [Kosmotoga pacifica]
MKRLLLFIFFALSLLSFTFAWELISNFPMLLQYESGNWGIIAERAPDEILKVTPYSNFQEFAVSLTREESQALVGHSRLYRLHFLRYKGDIYPIVINAEGTIVKDSKTLLLIYAALTGMKFEQEKVIDYYKEVNVIADLLIKKLNAFTFKDRGTLASAALVFLNQLKGNELEFSRFMEKALEKKTPYYELILYDTASVLKNELSKIKASSVEYYKKYSTYPPDSILTFNFAKELYDAHAKAQAIYSNFKSLSYPELERTLIEFFRAFIIEKATTDVEKLMSVPKEILEEFRISETKSPLSLLDELIERPLPEAIPASLPPFITTPPDGSILTLNGSTNVTITWGYTLPYQIQPLFTVSYGKQGARPQAIYTKSKALTLQVTPFATYEIELDTPDGISYKMRFSTLLGELPPPSIPSVLKVFKEEDRPIVLKWKAPLANHNFKYKVVVRKTEQTEIVSSNSISLVLDAFQSYTIDIQPIEIDGFTIPQELRKIATTTVEVLPSYPVFSHFPEKSYAGAANLTWKVKTPEEISEYIVRIYLDPKGKEEMVYEKTEEAEYQITLEPHKTYYWTVDIKYKNGKILKNIDSSGKRILWTLEVINAKPTIEISPMQGTIYSTKTVVPIKLVVKDEDGDDLVVGYEKSETSTFESPTVIATALVKGIGEATFPVNVPEEESFFIRGFVYDGYDKSYSSPVSLSMQYHWVAEPDGITTDSTTVELYWELKEPKISIDRYRIIVSWEIYKEVVGKGRVKVGTKTKTYETPKNSYTLELNPHTEYTWQVTAILHDKREGPHSSPLTFRTPNSKPEVTVFLNNKAFEDNDLIDVDNDIIRWIAKDPDGDNVKALLRILYNGKPIYEITPSSNEVPFSKIPLLKGNKNYTLELLLDDGIGPEFGVGKVKITKVFKTKNRPPVVNLTKPDDVQNPDDVHFTVYAEDPDMDSIHLLIKLDGIPVGTVDIDHKASETISLTELLKGNFDKIRLYLDGKEKIVELNGIPLLKGHTEYEVTVIASDKYGGSSSDIIIVPVSNRNPEKPVIIEPEDNSVHDLSKAMHWTSKDYDGDTINFEILVNNESMETIVSTSTNTYSWAMDKVLTGNRKYLVKVIAKDTFGGSSESDWVSFYAPNRNPIIEDLKVKAVGAETLDASISWVTSDPDLEAVSANLLVTRGIHRNTVYDETLPASGNLKLTLPAYGHYNVILTAIDEHGGITKYATSLIIPDRSPRPTNPSTPVEVWFEKLGNKYKLNVKTDFVDPDGDSIELLAKLYELTEGTPVEISESKAIGEGKLSRLLSFKGLKGHTNYVLTLSVWDKPEGIESRSIEFNMDLTSPNSAPTLNELKPDPFRKDVPYSPTHFSWVASDFENDTIHYSLEIREEGSEESVIVVTDETATELVLKPHTNYHWNVKASDDFGGVFQSDDRLFSTLNNAPELFLYQPIFEPGSIDPIFIFEATDVDGDPFKLLFILKDEENGEIVYGPTVIEGNELRVTSDSLTGHHLYIATLEATEVEPVPLVFRKGSTKTIEFKTPNRSPRITDLRINGLKADNSLTINKNDVRLDWKAFDPDGDVLNYNLTLILIDGKNEVKVKEIKGYEYTRYHFEEPLKGHARYKLIIEAFDSYNGLATETVFFNTENTPPEILSLVAPKGTDISTQTEFSWSAYDDDGDLLNFELSIWSEDRNYRTKITVKKGVTSYIVSEGLPGHTRYYWNVKAFDGHGGEVISKTETFETLNTPPNVVLGFPLNGASELPDTIRFQWRAYDEDADPLFYTFYLYEDGEFVYSATTQEPYLEMPRLKGNTRYSWYVEVEDGYVNEPIRSNKFDFVVRNHAPIVNLVIPKEKLNPDFAGISCFMFDLDGDILKGKLRILDKTGKDVVEPIEFDSSSASPVYITDGLIGNKEYKAVVLVYDGHGGTATDSKSFFTANRPPVVPEPVSPSNFAVVDTDFRDFTWIAQDPDGDRLSYDIILECLTVDDILEIFDTASTRFKTSFLRPYSIYRWKVTVRDEHGAVTEGPYWYFITNPSSDKGYEPYFTSMTTHKLLGETLILAGTLKGELLIFHNGKQIGREKLSKDAITGLASLEYFDLFTPEEIQAIEKATGRFFDKDTWPLVIAKDEIGNTYKIIITDAEELSRGKNLFVFLSH